MKCLDLKQHILNNMCFHLNHSHIHLLKNVNGIVPKFLIINSFLPFNIIVNKFSVESG